MIFITIRQIFHQKKNNNHEQKSSHFSSNFIKKAMRVGTHGSYKKSSDLSSKNKSNEQILMVFIKNQNFHQNAIKNHD